ncbi:unnamed protein product [Adineta ricciae]|uniref:Uncharacterized protein n=1 Tax=Adineta ricciae TaxID=249248 RepID=A0A815WNH8_ADIRI|nr:unnamed protein product [Adineta ricciae]
MKNALKIGVDVSTYASLESLKDPGVIGEISKKVIDILEKKGQTARLSAVEKASINAVSLLLSKKKPRTSTFLSVYLTTNVLESLCDTVVPTVSSDDNGIESDNHESQNSSSDSHNRQISFSMRNEVIQVDATFEYLFDYFKYSLSKNSGSMNLEKIVYDICTYICFSRAQMFGTCS